MNDAMDRWVAGHHLFVIFIQGISITLHRFETALSQARFTDANKELRDATKLLQGAATAMKFAADFSEEVYLNTIRPSMPRSFSGLDMVDHRDMLKVMKRVKPVFETLPPEMREAKTAFIQALSDAYDCHIFVCGQFVSGQSSLRTADAGNMALNTLNNLKQQRLRTLDEQRRQVFVSP